MKRRYIFNRTGGLEDVDFRAMGFRCGLEIHHQIFTEKKLFCRCPAGKYSHEYQAEVLRHMRPTLSELGEYDGCALMEFKTKKEVIYRLNKESVCTYEMDDTPPFPINLQALDIAIEIALSLNCNIVGEIHITRKQYLDGSIPTGFQRTTIVGVEGWIPYKGRKIGIYQLALEEDACREVSDIGHRITFTTGRLSMPLIEVVTKPDMLDPLEAAEVGNIIGTLLRLTGKVRRGAGAVRQDVNVSITGSTRVEIKGVPRLGYIPRLTGFEAMRQKSLIELRDEVHRRGFYKAEDFQYRFIDLTSSDMILSHPFIGPRMKDNYKLKAVVFPGLAGLMSYRLNPKWNFASEVGARVRVIACLDQMPNILHTDPGDEFYIGYGYSTFLREMTGCGEKDLAVITMGPAEDVETALQEIVIRVQETALGVINETRQYRLDGLSDFERILPGPDRMYPDTDSPPTAVTDEMIARASAVIPLPPWVRADNLRELGVSDQVTENLMHSPLLNELEKAVKIYPESAGLFAQIINQLVPYYQKKTGRSFSREEILQLLKLTGEKSLVKETVTLLLSKADGKADWAGILKDIKEIKDERIVDETISRLYNENGNCDEIPLNGLVGMVK
ncbi:MAG: Glu-tRNA(Gln) amidotransferase subunit GatE, partial [FCB group bacterium]|nr:Glu-tRNA(Gln) amidotransferase subunit GatE [FCB group bacterium]